VNVRDISMWNEVKVTMTYYGNFCFLLLLSLSADLSNAYGEAAAPAYVPGQVLIMLDSTAHEFSKELRKTNQSQPILTGYTVFDSLSKVHSLQSIDASPESPLTRTLFTLKFPGDADIPRIAAAYARIASVAVAEPNYLLHTAIGAPVDDSARSRIQVGAPQRLARRLAPLHISQRPQVLQVSLSDAYPETLKAIRNAMQRDTMWTGISSFDSLKHELGLTWFHISALGTDVSKDSLSLFLAGGDQWDIREAAERFRVLPYVVHAVSYPQNALKEPE
jgi:hypothetical protein